MAGAVRQPIDVANLQRFLKDNVPEIALPISIKQFGLGNSNPTYQLTAHNGSKYVLRKKPPQVLISKTAHNIEREYRIMRALAMTDLPVPKTYCLCEDKDIIGTPFYLMSFIQGRIFEDPALPGIHPADRTSIWQSAVQTLARLHRVDVRDVGLDRFGRPSGFYDRQLTTLTDLIRLQGAAMDVETGKVVGEIPGLNEILRFLRTTQPKDRTTIIHGDYKIDNLVFHPTKPEVIGILDWEISTRGHPLSDLVNLTVPFLEVDSALGEGTGRGQAEFAPGATPGLPSRSQIVEWYVAAAGWDPSEDIEWGDAFGMFRATVIVQGIAARYATRQSSGLDAMRISTQIEPFAEYTARLIRRLQGRRKARTKL